MHHPIAHQWTEDLQEAIRMDTLTAIEIGSHLYPWIDWEGEAKLEVVAVEKNSEGRWVEVKKEHAGR